MCRLTGSLPRQHDDLPYLSATVLEAGLPVTKIPENVIAYGPVVLDVAPAEQQDPELAACLSRAPTVLINLGSGVSYSEAMARAMTEALVTVFESTDAQVLWKFRKVGHYESENGFREPVDKYIQSGRLRLEKWLDVDPVSLMNTGHITLSVHHRGANCYYETVL